MATVVFEEQIEVPSIEDLAGFRAWALSDEFPQRGRIDYIGGRIEVDMSPEDLFTHGTLKLQVAGKIEARVAELELGHAFVGETRVSSIAGNVSAEPDVVVISHDALDEGRVTLVPKATGEQGRYVEIEGAVDLIVEIVSDSSVRKDTQRLPAAYYRAGVRENWLIDCARRELGFPDPAAWRDLLRSDSSRRQRISTLRSSGLPGSPRPRATSAGSLGVLPYARITSSVPLASPVFYLSNPRGH